MNVFTIQIDYREKTPWLFSGARGTGIPYRLKMQKVKSGDYTFVGGDRIIAVERKTMADFLHTMSVREDSNGKILRERFALEICRLQSVKESYIIVEAPLNRILKWGGAIRGRIAKILLFKAIIRLKKIYPKTRWIFAQSREDAEKIAFFRLHRAWQQARRRGVGDATEGEDPESGASD